jgi:hypothetical protein
MAHTNIFHYECEQIWRNIRLTEWDVFYWHGLLDIWIIDIDSS